MAKTDRFLSLTIVGRSVDERCCGQGGVALKRMEKDLSLDRCSELEVDLLVFTTYGEKSLAIFWLLYS